MYQVSSVGVVGVIINEITSLTHSVNGWENAPLFHSETQTCQMLIVVDKVVAQTSVFKGINTQMWLKLTHMLCTCCWTRRSDIFHPVQSDKQDGHWFHFHVLHSQLFSLCPRVFTLHTVQMQSYIQDKLCWVIQWKIKTMCLSKKHRSTARGFIIFERVSKLLQHDLQCLFFC